MGYEPQKSNTPLSEHPLSSILALNLSLKVVCNAFSFSACTILRGIQPFPLGEKGGQDIGKHHEDGSDIDGCSNEDDGSQEERG